MAFNIYNVNQRDKLTLVEILFNEQGVHKKSTPKKTHAEKRDSFTISNEAKELINNCKSNSISSNTRIDQSIDIKSCFANAKKANQEAIASAGDEITANNYNLYTSEIDVYRTALLDKYTRLLKEAQSHSNPEGYISEKYHNPNSKYYVSDLSEVERSNACHLEINMLNYGRISSSMQDSLFRGLTLGPETSLSRNEFNRQMVNSQINNILKKNGIEISKDQELSFSVAPYTYKITVDGVDFETKLKVEQALNVGSNGENLYNHIRSSATCGDIKSSQISKEGTMKNRLYYNLFDMTGLDIRTLNEKDGTYYTDSGENVIALYNKGVNESTQIPAAYKAAAKEVFAELVHKISLRGWNNMADMFLSINYNQSGLIDKNQNHGFGATDREWLEKMINDEGCSVI